MTHQPKPNDTIEMNNEYWKLVTQIRINNRLVGAYSNPQGKLIQLRYESTGHVITTATLPSDMQEPRQRYRHIVSKLKNCLPRKDDLGPDYMAGAEGRSASGAAKEMSGMRRAGGGCTSDLLPAVPREDYEHPGGNSPGLEIPREKPEAGET